MALLASRHIVVASLLEVFEATEKMVNAADDSSFVAICLELRRHVAGLGCTFVSSALWVDLSSTELVDLRGRGIQAIQKSLAGDASPQPHPLLELLAPTLRGERALAMVIGGPPDDNAVRGASDLAQLLASKLPAARPSTIIEATAVREGFAQQDTDTSKPVINGCIFAAPFQEFREMPGSPLPELLQGEIKIRSCGFPARALPSLQPYMSRYQITNRDRARLHLAAETEIAEFEEKGWVAQGAPTAAERSQRIQPSEPLYAQLADYYQLPDAELTTTTVRWYARNQDQCDPLVRTIIRLREDVALAVALLPLCAAHPFNALRLLRLGGIHSLLGLLSDASALAPGHGEMAPAVDALSPAEIAALVLAALVVFAPIRRFLISQCIFELLAVAIRHPASDRHLLIFSGLFARICQDPEHRQAAAGVMSLPLAEQVTRLFGRPADGGQGALLEAVVAASASLSPFLPVATFEPALAPLLFQLGGSAPESFGHLACSLALSVRRNSDLDLGSFVPRLLSLVPLEPPETLDFHRGAAAILALCSHTAAITSLSRPWVASTATAVLRRMLRAGPRGLSSIRVSVPLAAAADAAPSKASEQQTSEWYSEVEEQLSMQATMRFTWRAGEHRDFSGTGASATRDAGFGEEPDGSPTPALRRQRWQGLSQLVRLAELPESPNSVYFQERPQFRLVVNDDRAEVFLSLSLLAVTNCKQKPFFTVDESASGQLGLWLCELPQTGAASLLSPQAVHAKRYRHQLDLRPPLHASAAAPGQTEHLVSFTLPRGLYTLIPFSSHEVLINRGPELAKEHCRGQGCGCTDLNLAQKSIWERGSQFASISAWAEAADLELFEADAWHQRLSIDGDLLAQSMPVWLCPAQDASPMEVLICVGSRDQDDEQNSLRGSEPCIDLWPNLSHRRVRNERTGALRIHVSELGSTPLRVSCVWQESMDPASWSRAAPRLLVYSSGPLTAYMPRLGPSQALSEEAAQESTREQLMRRWQASALFSGGWTQGYSSGYGSLRNPQVVIEVTRGPGRGEELQLDFYLSVPAVRTQANRQSKERPKPAITIFSRTESLPGNGQEHRSGNSGPPERLVEGQLRKELSSSKVTVGGYVCAQLVLSGAEARQPLFVVLQNNDPQETWPWQLRVLARIRPKADPEVAQAPTHAPVDNLCSVEAHDDPPLRATVMGGTVEPGRIYGWCSQAIALYIPKASKVHTSAEVVADGIEVPWPRQEQIAYAWMLGKKQWSQSELVQSTAACGAVIYKSRLREPGPWPAPEPTPRTTEQETAVDFQSSLAPPPRMPIIPIAADDLPIRAKLLPDDVSSAQPPAAVTTEVRAKLLSNDIGPAQPPAAVEAQSQSKPAIKPAPAPPRRGAQISDVETLENEAAPVASSGVRTPRVPRQESGSQAKSEATASRGQFEQHDAQSERHLRVQALLRRRRRAYGRLSPEDDQDGMTDGQSSSLPPRFRGRVGSKEVTECDVAHSQNDDGADKLDKNSGGAPPAMPSLPPAMPASRPGRAGANDRGIPQSARGRASDQSRERRSPSLPPVLASPNFKCCHFAGHPVFCCSADIKGQAENIGAQHLVRLERKQGAERLGFGNVAAGPANAPVLVVSWIRDGALTAWNLKAPEGRTVPLQSAIVSVNGVSGDVQRMREELRAEVVEMEVVAPDRWKYNKVVNSD
eukprot:TRINITY_DN104628_c0_g1_i1.p1 TRINITY_DN104628_c0_g1~~TRINITY_DN104628_c0_g1_i1.p1  ORF type:complete len:1702 (+),score=256.35 TRINITY_DN104628_c0_g1_i1:87-5108(+)